MSDLKLGVFLDNMNLPLEQAMDKCRELGVDGFQVYVTKGAMLAENMDAAARKQFRKDYHARGLELSATCCDFGVNFGDPKAEAYIPKFKAAVDQALDLGTEIITTHIGKIPANLDPAVCDPMRRVIEEVGRYAEDKGVTFATETGPESGKTLADFLGSCDTFGIGANFDPANLVMGGFDHIQAVRDLAEFIVHAHAKDGKKGNGEVALGQGDVDFPKYLAVMEEIGFESFHVIEREAGPDPIKDIAEAVKFLRSL
jgi:sugar phosphate isomerase/epimerase